MYILNETQFFDLVTELNKMVAQDCDLSMCDVTYLRFKTQSQYFDRYNFTNNYSKSDPVSGSTVIELYSDYVTLAKRDPDDIIFEQIFNVRERLLLKKRLTANMQEGETTKRTKL